MLPNATIIYGDGTDRNLLDEEGLATCEAFAALTGMDEENILRIAGLMVQSVAARLAERDIHLTWDDEALQFLAKEGFDPKYGARPLRRAIQSKVEDAVAEKMLDGTLQTGDTAKLAVEDDKLVVTK